MQVTNPWIKMNLEEELINQEVNNRMIAVEVKTGEGSKHLEGKVIDWTE